LGGFFLPSSRTFSVLIPAARAGEKENERGEDKIQKSEVRSQKSEVGTQDSGVRIQDSGKRKLRGNLCGTCKTGSVEMGAGHLSGAVFHSLYQRGDAGGQD
jgi:hypothetical protein